MKAHILKSASKVVKNYPQNSARFSTMTIIIIHLQLLATFFISYNIKQDRFNLLNIIIQILRVFTLQIIVEEFPNLSMGVYLTIITVTLIALIMTISIKYQYVTRYFWYWIPLISPVVMGMGTRAYLILDIIDNIPGFEIFLLCSTGGFVVLWVIRRLIFIETFGQANMSIQRQTYIWAILITVGNYSIAIFSKRFQIVTIFSLVMIILVIFVELFRFSYIYPELEYVDFVCKFACLGVCVAQIISYYFDDSLLYLLALIMLGVYFLEKLSFMKSLLSMKYIFLCKKVSDEQTSDNNLIVLVVLLCRKKAIQFKLGFEEYLQMAYIEILHKIGISSFVEYSQLKREYLFEFLENRYDHTKEEDLNIFLAYWFMHYKMFIKAVKYMTYLSQQKDSFFVLLNNSILTQRNKTFLKNCRLLNVKEQEPASHSLCRMDPNAVKQIDPQDMFIRQAKLQQLTKMVSEAFQTQTYLTKRLLVTSINANQIQNTMKKLWQKKNKIIKFLKQNQQQFKHKQFVIIQYLFWTVSCHKKFMVFQDLQKTFLPFIQSDNIESVKDDFLAVIVSGENDSIGIIVLANKSMREFFNLSIEKVRSRSENIDQILPRSISQQHNAFLYSFKQRGTSKFIGKPQDNFIVIKQGEIYRTDAYIKIYQHLDGLMFAGRLKILQSTDKFILYDAQGFIQNFSKQFELKNDKAQLLNIYDMIDNSSQQSHNSEQQHLNLKQKAETRTKRHGSELAKTSLRKRYSDSKLKGSMSLFVNNRRIKATFDYFLGQKYFQGICIANLQSEIDERSLKQIAVLKQDVIKQESVKSLTSETCEKNYFEMERRVWDNKSFANRFITPFMVAICLLFVSISISIGLSEMNMFSRVEEFKTLSFLQHYSQGYRASLFEVGSLAYIYHAVNSKQINNTDATSLGYPDMISYVNKSFSDLMLRINNNYVNILAHLPDLPLEFSDVFTDPIIPLNPNYNLSYHQVGNYAQYLFKQVSYYTPVTFQMNWAASTVILIQFFTNQFMYLINLQVYPKLRALFDTFVSTRFNTQRWIIYVFICIEAVVALCIAFIYSNIINQKRKTLQLLSHLSDKQLLQDLAKIQIGLSVTEQLGRYEVENFMVNDKYRTLSFQLVSQSYSFRCQQIKQNTYWQQQAQNIKSKKKKTIRFPLRVTKSSTNTFLLLLILGTLVYYYKFFFETIDSITRNIQFYFSYSSNINDVNIAESGLLLCNMQSYVSGTQNISYMGLTFNQSIASYKTTMFNRTYVDTLVKNIPWELAKPMLFESYCKTGETLCEMVLESSFTRGANTASISFALQNLVLIDKFPVSNLSEVKNQLILFMISYVDYFAPYFDSSLNQSRNIVFYLFDQAFLNLQFISKFIIVPMILLCLLGMSLNLYVLNKQIKFLNRQIFSIYSVDILTKHMQFAYQINKLK